MKVLQLAIVLVLSLAAFVLPAYAVNVCSPDRILSNTNAAYICPTVCAKSGGTNGQFFTGNWSNEKEHPPVKACIHSGKGKASCECAKTSLVEVAKKDPEVVKACDDLPKVQKDFETYRDEFAKYKNDSGLQGIKDKLAEKEQKFNTTKTKCWDGTMRK
jgi:hypothetical protein